MIVCAPCRNPLLGSEAQLRGEASRREGHREGRDSSKVRRGRSSLRVRQHVQDTFDQARTAPRNLLGVPPVLHGSPEADRHRGTGRALYQKIRRADLGAAQDRRNRGQGCQGIGCEGKDEDRQEDRYGLRVRKVIEYLSDATAGMLCSKSRRASPEIRYAERASSSTS